MGFRYRKSVQIAPGIRVNAGKKSTSISFGGKSGRYTISSTGRRTATIRTGIPGLSYTVSGGSKKKKVEQLKKVEPTLTKEQLIEQMEPKQKNYKVRMYGFGFVTLMFGIVSIQSLVSGVIDRGFVGLIFTAGFAWYSYKCFKKVKGEKDV